MITGIEDRGGTGDLRTEVDVWPETNACKAQQNEHCNPDRGEPFTDRPGKDGAHGLNNNAAIRLAPRMYRSSANPFDRTIPSKSRNVASFVVQVLSVGSCPVGRIQTLLDIAPEAGI